MPAIWGSAVELRRRSALMEQNAKMGRPVAWSLVGLVGLALFAGSIATGQFSIFYTPLVLVIALGAFGLAAYLALNNEA